MNEAKNAQAKQESNCLTLIIVGGIAALFGGFVFYREFSWLKHFEDKDVEMSHDAAKAEGISPGASYFIPSDFYVARGPQGYYLDQPFSGQAYPPSNRPQSRSQYDASRERWPHIERFLQDSAVFKVERVYRHISFEYSNIYVIGTVFDGTYTYQNVKWSWPKLGKPLPDAETQPKSK